MEPSALPWLDAVIGAAAGAAVALLFAVNGAFAVGLLVWRSRGFVDRWTKPLVVADAALLITAIGAPVLGVAMKLGIHAFALITAAPAQVLPGK